MTASAISSRSLTEGAIVEYENRYWRVGLVNESRARLDPLQGNRVTVAPGHSFNSYGSSVNIGPTSALRMITEEELSVEQVARVNRLRHGPNTNEGVDPMAVASTPVAPSRKPPVAKSKVAGMPVARAVKAPTAPVELSPCKCGCGKMVAKHFYAGHDARFKGWLLQIERGKLKKEEVLTAPVIAQYKWVKTKDGGERPTTNYKGEKHTGYDKAAPADAPAPAATA